MKTKITIALLLCLLLSFNIVSADGPATAESIGELQPLSIEGRYLPAGSPIQFGLGETSAVINGFVQANSAITYNIYAMQGQTFILLLTSDSGSAYMNVTDIYGNVYSSDYQHNSYFSMILPATCQYNVDIIAGGSGTNFSLQVFIPAKVQIPLGQKAVSYNGAIGPYGVVSYTASASAGQIAKIDCYSGAQPLAWLRVSGMQSGVIYQDYTAYSPSWYVYLPETQDYLVEVITLDQGTAYTITFEFD